MDWDIMYNINGCKVSVLVKFIFNVLINCEETKKPILILVFSWNVIHSVLKLLSVYCFVRIINLDNRIYVSDYQINNIQVSSQMSMSFSQWTHF